MVWLAPPTGDAGPPEPQMAPEMDHGADGDPVLTLMPAYRAVRSLSPTTAISYPCLQ